MRSTHHVIAIRPDGEGDVTNSHVTWHQTNVRCYVPSPVVVDGYLIVADDRGTANCFDTKTGQRLWQTRMGTHYSASLGAAGGLVYLFADDGVTKILRPGPSADVLAENQLGENVYSSPAFSDGQLFIRGEKHLFCIGKKKLSKSLN
jgi:outer membrane protein assembly factor BamB